MKRWIQRCSPSERSLLSMGKDTLSFSLLLLILLNLPNVCLTRSRWIDLSRYFVPLIRILNKWRSFINRSHPTICYDISLFEKTRTFLKSDHPLVSSAFFDSVIRSIMSLLDIIPRDIFAEIAAKYLYHEGIAIKI